ncbi:MAG: hypothetical protein VX899_06255 [Myxococcota bacterium]|nr:hypothetical protein [Myxococcota bacterium]
MFLLLCSLGFAQESFTATPWSGGALSATPGGSTLEASLTTRVGGPATAASFGASLPAGVLSGDPSGETRLNASFALANTRSLQYEFEALVLERLEAQGQALDAELGFDDAINTHAAFCHVATAQGVEILPQGSSVSDVVSVGKALAAQAMAELEGDGSGRSWTDRVDAAIQEAERLRDADGEGVAINGQCTAVASDRYFDEVIDFLQESKSIALEGLVLGTPDSLPIQNVALRSWKRPLYRLDFQGSYAGVSAQENEQSTYAHSAAGLGLSGSMYLPAGFVAALGAQWTPGFGAGFEPRGAELQLAAAYVSEKKGNNYFAVEGQLKGTLEPDALGWAAQLTGSVRPLDGGVGIAAGVQLNPAGDTLLLPIVALTGELPSLFSEG